MSKSFSKLSSSSSSSSTSSTNTGIPPRLHLRINSASLVCSAFSFLYLLRFEGHLDILIDFACQSISGLCFSNHVNPRMAVCFPNCVTANCTLSECPSYRKTRSAISRIIPASFEVPSTLKTSIGRDSVLVGIRFSITYFESRNWPVAPQSTSALVERRIPVSVDWSSMSTLRDFELGIAASTYFCRSLRSHIGLHISLRIRTRLFGKSWAASITSSTFDKSSFISSTSRQAYLFTFLSNEGALITRCGSQNPPRAILRSIPLLQPFLRRRHPFQLAGLRANLRVRPKSCVECRSELGIRAKCAQASRTDNNSLGVLWTCWRRRP